METCLGGETFVYRKMFDGEAADRGGHLRQHALLQLRLVGGGKHVGGKGPIMDGKMCDYMLPV